MKHAKVPVLYVYHKCSTCQKALRFLKDKVQCKVREITDVPPSQDELRKMLEFKKGNVRSLFNTSGKLYRELNLSEKLPKMTVDESLSLLSENGMLVKRPFLIGDDFGLTGFREKEWVQIFSPGAS